ncbi:MAG: hypothetical protein NTU69_09200 [Proteobacteria bacterium]|nr:hypothetical protein [Pseudomonadota bacterium]
MKDVETNDLGRDNLRASHLNHATWIKDDGCSIQEIPDTENDKVRIRLLMRSSPDTVKGSM